MNSQNAVANGCVNSNVTLRPLRPANDGMNSIASVPGALFQTKRS